ncbi:MAG: hypothetical protein EOL97_07840 [Spirochaetia bacterium]|nr:hypothetical protein [Spirochaetia bacterium]
MKKNPDKAIIDKEGKILNYCLSPHRGKANGFQTFMGWTQSNEDADKMIKHIRENIKNSDINKFRISEYGISFNTIFKINNFNKQTCFSWQYDYDRKLNKYSKLPRLTSGRIEEWKRK